MDQSGESKFNAYGVITEKIVRAIKDAKGKYVMPWHATNIAKEMPANAATGKSYRGVNILSLWIDATVHGYATGYWASYKQWQSFNAQVRYGERGAVIIFFKPLEQRDEEEGVTSATRAVARASWVFNAAQVDNWNPPEPANRSPVEIDAKVDAFVKAIEARVEHGFPMAQYRVDLDRIEMPNASWFIQTATQSAWEGYHSTLFHELTHWTGASHRLDRALGKNHGAQAYAFEELVAELGAAFLCATFGITNEPREDHAAYVASWLELLRNDTRAIFRAASHAQEAAIFLGSLAASKFDTMAAPANGSAQPGT